MDPREFRVRQDSLSASLARYLTRLLFGSAAFKPMTPTRHVEIARVAYPRVERVRQQSRALGAVYLNDMVEQAGHTPPLLAPERPYEPRNIVTVLERTATTEAMNPRPRVTVTIDGDPVADEPSRVTSTVTVAEAKAEQRAKVKVAVENTTAALVRHAEMPGREAVTDSIDRAGEEIGWARVLTGRESCGFCAMLASRGPVYSSEASARYRGGVSVDAYHDHCDCIVVPVYDGEPWQGQEEFERLEDIWIAATLETSGAASRAAFRKAYGESLAS